MRRLRRLVHYYLVGRAAWLWWLTGHTDRMGHDHHCPCVSGSDWVNVPQPNCTCGWAGFRQAMHALEEAL